jgi:phosphate transport system substrate-binding protein
MHIRLKHIQHAAGLGRRASTVRLTRVGSTFDAPFFTKAFAAYQQSRPGVTVSYASVGSSAGITRFTAGTVNFGATDVPASSTDLAAARGGPAVQVPVDLGGISVAYNVMTLNGSLRLTGPVLARIFLGQITGGTTRPSPPSTPAPSCPTRTSPSYTAPTAAAPPKSSATTSPTSAPPGPRR